MKKALLVLTPSIFAACSGDEIPVDPEPGDPCAALSNPIDRALCPELTAAGYQPLLASSAEVCTRLAVDMIGRRPTPDERAGCEQLGVGEMVSRYAEHDAYRIAQRRRWADRLSYADAAVDPYAIQELDRLVDDLYREKLGYSDFAVQALSHPAFVGRFIGYGLPEDVARAAFRVFLGRVATRPEAQDLAPLWSLWVPGYTYRGVDRMFGFPYGPIPYVDLLACEAGVRSCSSSLVGKASVEIHPNGRTGPIPTSQLTEEDWEAMRAPGRLLAGMDIFWEAAVDEVLQTYLGYDAGTIRPAVRDALVRELEKHQSLVRLERTVLTSILYTQAASLTPEAAAGVPASLQGLPIVRGPSKLMTPEAWLHSMGVALGSFVGDCDFRYPDLASGNFIDFNTGAPLELYGLDDFYPRNPDGTYDTTFRDTAASMGGCPGRFDLGTFSVVGRSKNLGLISAVGQEIAVLDLCLDSPAEELIPVTGTDASPDAIRTTIAHVLERLLGGASEADVDEVVARASEGCPGCDAGQVGRELCTAIAGGVEYIIP